MSIILYLFYAILTIAYVRQFLRLLLSLSYNFKRKRNQPVVYPKISIIVPAYNEEKTICACLQSLKNLDYPNYEVVVVDDGSTDRTFEVASQFGTAKVIRQKNMGKPNALNNGVLAADGEIILTVDADTTIDRYALRWIAARFGVNKRLGAVAGNVKINKEKSLLNAVQSAEYAIGINLVRKGQSVLGSVLIVPGPVAALRREAIACAGFFSDDTFAEDFDVTLKIIKSGYLVEYEEASMAYTDAPKNIEDLIKQRRRWYRGMIQALEKHSDMYFNGRYGSAGMFGVPNLWFDAVSPFLNIGLLLVTLLLWLFTGDIQFSLVGIAGYLMLSLGVGIVGLSLEPNPEKRNYLALPLLIVYNTFLEGIRIMSLTEELVNIIMDWEKPRR